MKTLLKGGQVVSGMGALAADVLIEGETILALGKDLETVEDIREHMEDIRQYVRGHNLYDIFYSQYRDQETELLTRYLQLAPREDFKHILDAIERFLYFESRKRD